MWTRLVLSVTQWTGQGHPCRLNKALCYGWATAGRARLLPHGVRKGWCVCVLYAGWGMCSNVFFWTLNAAKLYFYFFFSLFNADTIPNNAERSKNYIHTLFIFSITFFFESVHYLYSMCQYFWKFDFCLFSTVSYLVIFHIFLIMFIWSYWKTIRSRPACPSKAVSQEKKNI